MLIGILVKLSQNIGRLPPVQPPPIAGGQNVNPAAPGSTLFTGTGTNVYYGGSIQWLYLFEL